MMVLSLLASDGITKDYHDERQPSPTTLLMTDVTSGDNGAVKITNSQIAKTFV